MSQPRVEVRAPSLVPYPFGLFSVVQPTIPDDEGHATSGVWWLSESAGAAGVTYTPCTVDAPDPIDALDPNVLCGVNDSQLAFTVYAYSDLSVGGLDEAAMYARAASILQAGEQFAVESQLWAKLVTDAAAGTGATGLVATLARAEAEAAATYAGSSVVHVSRYNAAMLGTTNARVEGAKLRTVLGSDMVAGGGYDDDDVVIVTGPIVMVRGPIKNLGRVYNAAENSHSAIVERSYVIGWDAFASKHTIA